MLTNQTRAALVQLLQALTPDAIRLLILKHFGVEPGAIGVPHLLEYIARAQADEVAGLLVELLSGNTAIRFDAPTKYVFDNRRNELQRRLRTDGFDVVEDALVRIVPAAEPMSHIADYLEQTLSTSGLDNDGEVRRLLQESHTALSASPPDCNGSTTKARIALETVARRSAASIASKRGQPTPEDSWGRALTFLRMQGVITQPEEEALARVYTLVSSGAHVPKGLTDEQWALLSRTFTVSGAYFLTRQYAAG
jgi:hypothetical protein